MGETSVSKEEEINTIEEEEAEKMYKAKYTTAWKPQGDYNRDRVGRTPKYKNKRNPKRKMNIKP